MRKSIGDLEVILSVKGTGSKREINPRGFFRVPVISDE